MSLPYGQQPQQNPQFGNSNQQYGGSPIPPSPTNSKTLIYIIIALVAVIVIGIAGVGIYLTTQNNDPAPIAPSSTPVDTSNPEPSESPVENPEKGEGTAADLTYDAPGTTVGIGEEAIIVAGRDLDNKKFTVGITIDSVKPGNLEDFSSKISEDTKARYANYEVYYVTITADYKEGGDPTYGSVPSATMIAPWSQVKMNYNAISSTNEGIPYDWEGCKNQPSTWPEDTQSVTTCQIILVEPGYEFDSYVAFASYNDQVDREAFQDKPVVWKIK